MVTIVEFTIPSESVSFGDAFSGAGGVSLELERIVPIGEEVIPFIWVEGADFDRFEERVRASANVRSLSLIDQVDGRRLYRVVWDDPPTDLLQALGDTGATVLSANGGDTWNFRLRFPDHDHLTQFSDICTDRGIPISVDRVYSPERESPLDDRFGLTSKERKALQLALDRGYFDTPRTVELRDLAADLDVSRQALSKRIRRANEKVLRTALRIDDRA